jgi:hypothetical protein
MHSSPTWQGVRYFDGASLLLLQFSPVSMKLHIPCAQLYGAGQSESELQADPPWGLKHNDNPASFRVLQISRPPSGGSQQSG